MKTGFSKKCITPPMGYPIVGYYEERLASGVISDLFVRAAAFDDGKTRAVILTADVCFLIKETCDQIRALVSGACGVDENGVFITCSHTHTGPLTSDDFASDKVADPAYMESLCLACRDAASEAFDDLKESRFFMAETEAEGISYVRRFLLKDGRVSKPYFRGDPDIIRPVGKPNHTLKLLKILRQGGRDLAMINFGTHADTVQGKLICADFPGFLCSTLESALPETDTMFLLAPQGDVSHINHARPDGNLVSFRKDGEDLACAAPHARYMGRFLAGKALTIYDRAEEITADQIRFGAMEMEIPTNKENHRLEEAAKTNAQYEAGTFDDYPGHKKTCLAAEARRILRMKDAPDTVKLQNFSLCLGDLVLVGFPGEPFTALRNDAEARSPFRHTIVCCLVNDAAGYIPYRKAYEEGSYEVLATTYGPKTADILVDGMMELLNRLK